jgi:transposase
MEIAPTLGREKEQGTRSPMPFREVFDGIQYVLWTGRLWKTLPREYGSGFYMSQVIPAMGQRQNI